MCIDHCNENGNDTDSDFGENGDGDVVKHRIDNRLVGTKALKR